MRSPVRRTTMTDETPRPGPPQPACRHGPARRRQRVAGAGGRKPSDEHVVLLGDSIFDNKAYVGSGPDVIDAARRRCCHRAGPRRSPRATARPPATSPASSETMPQDATHLVVSVGGNNALGEKGLIEESARSVAEVLDKLAKIKAAFAKSYGAMLDGVLARSCRPRSAPSTRRITRTRPRARSRRLGSERVQRRDHARGVRARAAGDRPQADHQRRTPTTPTTSSLRSKAGPRSRERSPRWSPPTTSRNGALWFTFRLAHRLVGLGVRLRRGADAARRWRWRGGMASGLGCLRASLLFSSPLAALTQSSTASGSEVA